MDHIKDADVIVVGSGILGALAAHYLALKNKSVIMLEAGVAIPRWKIVENYRNSARKFDYNDPYPNQPWANTSFEEGLLENSGNFNFKPGMLKLVGGTTWHWAAMCWRYLPHDMKLKSTYGVGRDWPISYEDLEHYYTLAEEALGVNGNNEEDQSGQNLGKTFPPRSKVYPMEPEAPTYIYQQLKKRIGAQGYHFIYEPNARATRPYDGRPECHGNNNCMPICPIGAQYSGSMHVDKAVRAGVKLIADATVYKIEKGDNNKITAVHYKSSTGEDVRLTAKYFIIAAHGLETPKLLLLSDVANSSDQVGRNLMDHTGMGLQFFADEPLWSGRGAIEQGVIVNWRDGSFRKQHSAIRHGISNYVPVTQVTQRLLSQNVIGKELDKRIRHDTARWVDISTVLEPLPEPSNTVRPNPNKKDALGIPMLKVNYNISPYIEAAKPRVLEDYKKFVAAMGGTVIEDNTGWQNRDHLMGTVIMGADPKDSVVDKDCRTYDHENLFLATTGVIPAAGVVNPTLTAAALSIRLAETIANEV